MESITRAAGSPDPNIYLSDRYPTPKKNRYSNPEIVVLLVENGWPRKRETLITATAVVNAESARDTRAYLAYCDLRVDRHSDLGLAKRARIDAIPQRTTLTTFRAEIRKIGCELARADCGLFQIGRPPEQDLTYAELMNPVLNVKKALRIYQSRGWKPWASYTTPREAGQEAPYRWFLDDAAEAVDAALAKLK